MNNPSPNSTTDGFLKTTHCESVSEFLHCLSPLHGLLATGFPDTWIYRGVVDDKHSLTPSALRRESRFRELVGWDADLNGDQRSGEMSLLKDFFERADRIALALPEDTQTLRRFFESKLPPEGDMWPREYLLSLMALAQHHGVPTRLLDWSRNPLKAVHFAAQPAPALKAPPERLCVWAFSLLHYELGRFGGIMPFTVVTAPGATNSNLGAQEGIFTVTIRIYEDSGAVDRRSFDEILRQVNLDHQVNSHPETFHRITLPRSFAPELLLALEIEGVTRATLFPNFYGVVETIEQSGRYRTEMPPSEQAKMLLEPS
jgi:hypothetical protein